MRALSDGAPGPAKITAMSPAPSTHTIRACTTAEVPDLIPHLARILVECVASGASVSFMQPYTQSDAEAFFTRCAASAARGERVILAAFDDITNRPEGTVQLVLDTPPNQPHRADVTKLLVLPEARNRGLARRLMQTLEQAAREQHRTLLVLDTLTGSPAERLYSELRWTKSGVIPDYALMPDGTGPVSTTVFWKRISPADKR
jgi:GNAT superfamily N-acetyltransferase